MKELYLTSYNTIAGDNFEEISVDKFFKIMNKNLGTNCNLTYTKYNNKFSVVFNGLLYDLVLDKIVMDNYALGNYNEFTYKLKKLIDKIEGKKPNDYVFIGAFIDDEESLAIIKDAKKGIFSDINSKRLFLDYLKQSKKNSSGLKNIFNNLFSDIKDIYNYYWKKVELSFILGVFSSIPSILIIIDLEFALFILSVILGGCFIANSYFLLQKNISRFKAKRITNQNIKCLELEIKKDELKLIENKRENEEKVEKIDDSILKEIANLFIRLEKINSSEKTKIKEDLLKIRTDYIEGRKKIQENELDDCFTLGENNIFGLKQEMLERTTEVDFKLHQLEDISAENRDFDEECQILESIMNNSSTSSGADRVIGGDRSPRARIPNRDNK